MKTRAVQVHALGGHDVVAEVANAQRGLERLRAAGDRRLEAP